MPNLTSNEIKLTDAAKAQLSSLIKQEPTATGIRLFLIAKGCAGQEYAMAYVNDATIIASDYALIDGDITLYIPAENLMHFFQMEIDYGVDELHNEAFIYRNPNVRRSCGCGESVGFDEALA